MKNGKNAQEMLHEYLPWKDAIADIEEELKKEMKKIQEEAVEAADGDAIVVPAAAAGSSGASGATAAVSADPESMEDTIEAKLPASL